MDVKYFVRFMDGNEQVHRQVYYELTDATKRFDEVIQTNPKFADLDIITTVNARTFESKTSDQTPKQNFDRRETGRPQRKR